MAHDREVAGIRCTQVLEGLSDYLDGELPHETRERVDAHLAQCSWCEHFGGEFTSVVKALRRKIASPPRIEDEESDAILDLLNLEAS